MWTARSAGCPAAGPRPASRGVMTSRDTIASRLSGPASSRRCLVTQVPTAAGWSTCAGKSTTRRRRPAGDAAEPGRSVGRLTDIGWGGALRKVLADGAPDGPVPDDLFGAVVTVLAAWDWAERPGGVVTLPSRSRPQLIAALGERIAAAGKLSYLGSLGYRTGGPPGGP